MTVNSGSCAASFAGIEFADEHIARKQCGPRMLRNDADRHPVAIVGARVTILDEEVLPLKVGAEALLNAGKLLRFDRPIHFAPADFAFAGGLAHEELILRQPTGILPGAHNERPEMTQHALMAADGLLVERGRGQVPIDVAEIFETEMPKAFEFLEE